MFKCVNEYSEGIEVKDKNIIIESVNNEDLICLKIINTDSVLLNKKNLALVDRKNVKKYKDTYYFHEEYIVSVK